MKHHLTLLCLLFLCGCGALNKIITKKAEAKFGYLPEVDDSRDNAKQYAEKWGISEDQLYFLDRKGYHKHIWKEGTNKELTHDLYQWHQMMIFDSKGELKSYQLNCRAPIKSKNWDWKTTGILESYPPQIDHSTMDFNKNVRLSDLSPYFIDQENHALSTEDLSNYEAVIVVYWTIYHGRQSENLIKAAKIYNSRFPEGKIKYVFLYNDYSG